MIIQCMRRGAYKGRIHGGSSELSPSCDQSHCGNQGAPVSQESVLGTCKRLSSANQLTEQGAGERRGFGRSAGGAMLGIMPKGLLVRHVLFLLMCRCLHSLRQLQSQAKSRKSRPVSNTCGGRGGGNLKKMQHAETILHTCVPDLRRILFASGE